MKKIKGNAWVMILILMVFLTTVGLSVSGLLIQSLRSLKRQEDVITAQSMADAGIEKAVWKFNNGICYTGENNIDFLKPENSEKIGALDIEIFPTSCTVTEKYITATAYIPNKENPTKTRQIKAKIAPIPDDEGIAFSYAVQVGLGGLNMGNDTDIFGSVYSNSSINGSGSSKSRISQNASAVGAISNVNVGGTTNTGVSPIPFPTYDENFWKDLANINNDPIGGNYAQTGGTFGPRRVNGDLTLTNVTITGPIYVTGALTFSGTTALDNSYGSTGTVVLVEGFINANGTINGTNATPKGHILFISKGNINLGAWLTGGVYYSPNGTITIQPHCNPIAITANTLTMQPNSDLTYQQGLATATYGLGGSGGSWGIKEWKVLY